MSLKTVFNFVKSKFLWVNVGIALASGVLIAGIILFSLRFSTNHGEEVSVPQLTGLYVEEAEALLNKAGLLYEVIDSVYVRNKLQGEIVEQVPEAESKVKEGRKIYLIINSMSDKLIVVPDVQNVSYRQARATLEACGFVISHTESRPSEFPNLVLDVRSGAISVKAGDRLPDGTRIVLVIGEKSDGEKAIVPDLAGLTLSVSEQSIAQNNFVLGMANYDESSTSESDKANFFVYRQSPEAGTNYPIGKRIDLWLTKNSDKLLNKSGDPTDEKFF